MRPSKFWLFAGEDCYPNGGLVDLMGVYANEDEAFTAARAGWPAGSDSIEGYHGKPGEPYDWWHIVQVWDSGEQRSVIARYGRGGL